MLTSSDFHQPTRNRQDSSASARRSRQERRRCTSALSNVDREESWSCRSLQRRRCLLTSRHALLRHLLPNLQSPETRLLRGEPNKEAWNTQAPYSRRNRWYARRLPNDTLRCYQDTIAGRGTKRRDEVQEYTGLCIQNIQ